MGAVGAVPEDCSVDVVQHTVAHPGKAVLVKIRGQVRCVWVHDLALFRVAAEHGTTQQMASNLNFKGSANSNKQKKHVNEPTWQG